ncbi:hypothetical protein KCP74_00145 [Salmonella enterica subsp. enterica]|nr:hypothetical protein KCP74_00145 [Salmonella enterica subsp. enterica]
MKAVDYGEFRNCSRAARVRLIPHHLLSGIGSAPNGASDKGAVVSSVKPPRRAKLASKYGGIIGAATAAVLSVKAPYR